MGVSPAGMERASRPLELKRLAPAGKVRAARLQDGLTTSLDGMTRNVG